MSSLVFKVDEISGKICCQECFEADPHAADWMARGSAARHLEASNKHKSSVAINVQHHEANESHHRQLQSTYTYTSYTSFNSYLPDPSPSTCIGLFDREEMPGLGPVHHDYIDDFPISAGISPHQHDPEAERELLHREVELMMMEAEQLDKVGLEQLEDDPTVTNMAQELYMLGKIILCIILFMAYFWYQALISKMMMLRFRMALWKPLTMAIMLHIQIK